MRRALCYAGRPRKSVSMRLLAPLLALSVGSTAALAGGVEVVRLLPEYMPAASFVRVSEYFNGKENTRGATIVRTQPNAREGFYFNLRTRAESAIEVAWVELQYISPAAPEPRTESFAVSLPRGSHLLRFGITGADWPDAKARPVAWKLRLLSADGAELATEQSYLWSMPEAPAAAPSSAPAEPAAPAAQ